MLKRIWAKLRTYFYYNQVERNGVLAFAVLLILLFSLSYLFDFSRNNNEDANRFFAQVDSIENTIQNNKVNTQAYFSFNPNTVNETDLQRLGFSEKQIRNLLNYRKAGGKFYQKADFQKLYFVNDSIYAIYEAYIIIPQQKKKLHR